MSAPCRSIDDPWMDESPEVVDDNDPLLQRLIHFSQNGKFASVPNLRSYLNGFRHAGMYADAKLKELFVQALMIRGYGWLPADLNHTDQAVREMKAKNMTDEQISKELVEVEITLYKLAKNAKKVQ